ncbi:MAG: PucR family transcriptional regulator ligand-binding domain-containing protein [Actinobacteria bacterium]|nr:PucR family transcriptional regulator ligand-binding domain-containing protein [Actinomycetota bacterium]
MLPTLRELLELPEIREGKPRVMSGAAGLDTPVRWLHISDAADPAASLRGGEVLLTTGRELGFRAASIKTYLDALIRVGAVALLVRTADGTLPEHLIAYAQAHGFPVIHLQHRIAFVEVTEIVHRRILASLAGRIERARRFDPDSVALLSVGTGGSEVVDELSAVVGRPVVQEDPARNIVHAANASGKGTGTGTPDPITWKTHSRLEHRRGSAHAEEGRSDPHRSHECIWAPITVDGSERGRLHVLQGTPGDFDAADQIALLRAATALGASLSASRAGITATHPSELFFTDLEQGIIADEATVRERARQLGLVLGEPWALSLALRARNFAETAAYEHARTVIETESQRLHLAALFAAQGEGLDILILPLAGSSTAERSPAATLDTLVTRLNAELSPTLVGGISAQGDLEHLGAALREARNAAIVALRADRPGLVRFDELGAERLVLSLVESGRLGAFVDRLIGPLLEDETNEAIMLAQVLVRTNGTISEAARALGVDRRTVMRRPAALEERLGLSLARPAHRRQIALALRTLPLVVTK